MALTQDEMPETKSPDAQDVLIFTRAVESVFRKLIRFLVGRMSLVQVQDLIRAIYLQEAEKNLQSKCAGDGRRMCPAMSDCCISLSSRLNPKFLKLNW